MSWSGASRMGSCQVGAWVDGYGWGSLPPLVADSYAAVCVPGLSRCFARPLLGTNLPACPQPIRPPLQLTLRWWIAWWRLRLTAAPTSPRTSPVCPWAARCGAGACWRHAAGGWSASPITAGLAFRRWRTRSSTSICCCRWGQDCTAGWYCPLYCQAQQRNPWEQL